MIAFFEIDDEEKYIDIPLHLSEITFSDFSDFKALENEYWELNKAEDKDSTDPINKLVQALRVVIKGDLDYIPFSQKDDSYEKLVDDKYQVKIGDELSIVRLYAHLVVLINKYRTESIPEEFKWTWAKKDYVLKSGPSARVLANKPLTTGEAIESLEYQRRAYVLVEKEPSDIGNIDFNLGLTEVAILLRRPGEQLPSNRKHLTAFIAKRKQLFGKMTLDKVMDMRFFLLNALVKSLKTRTTSSFGTAPQVVARSKSRKNKGVWKKWREKLGRLTGGVFSTK